MEPQQPAQQASQLPSQQGRSTQHPQLHTIIPPTPANFPQRTANSTPMSSPGLFSPSNPRPKASVPAHAATEVNTPAVETNSPFLHPLQNHKVRETHKALVDLDFATGRKIINQYEVIEEIGRGVHGKVKLARNLESGDNVAIKIIPRFSKTRRLGKVTAMSQQDKTKKEIAILKKIRHPNVVALLEVIDDPELKKIYMVLEHVELGEIVWRKKGLPVICAYERRRVEREMRGEAMSDDIETYTRMIERRQQANDLKRAKMSQSQISPNDFWSNEYGAAEEEEGAAGSRVASRANLFGLERIPGSVSSSVAASRATSRAPSRSQSVKSMEQAALSSGGNSQFDDIDTPGPLRSNPNSSTALEGTMYGPYADDPALRRRSPSMADSIISHMSSEFNSQPPQDPFADDFSYVPCFTIDQARRAFRDTVLGLEYLHYQGVVHRDIKPANLLWTKDHRVKISDFGVSYFGRPIRDGEPDDVTLESEAKDFDDDLELSKTVGTPAFFAPELCYTDLDKEQPRISEQIDVWSLGVTLYCLIFARIPFLAEDEFQMWRKIATEEVYIPRKRLRPVDPSTDPYPNLTDLAQRQNKAPYRDDKDLVYEEIDTRLYELLRLMLTKNPEKRIRLRDIKRHPWVVQDIQNPLAWLDDTDPARPSSGRRIQVDEREMSYAVVPITFLERARSAVKKAVGKVMHPLGERAESKSRIRAGSSANSSAGDSLHNVPPTPHPRDIRRKSLKGDDYFTGPAGSEHPLSQSVTATPHDSPINDVMATAIRDDSFVPRRANQQSSESLAAQSTGSLTVEPDVVQPASPPHTLQHRRSHGRGSGQTYLPLTPSLPAANTMPSTSSYDGHMDDPSMFRKARDPESTMDDSSRARSVDRGLFASEDKRAQPKVAVSTAVAPGSIQSPRHPRSVRSIDLGNAKACGSSGLASPLIFSPRAVAGYQHGSHQSDPNMHAKQRIVDREVRPQTAHRVENITEARSPPSRHFGTPEPYARVRLQDDAKAEKRLSLPLHSEIEPAYIPCPPSPREASASAHPPPPPSSREETMSTAKSSSSTSFGALTTPLTSPSEMTSPVSAADFSVTKTMSEQMLAFQSDPSLPALLSGASSVSNDIEGELQEPGVVTTARAPLPEAADSLTPRAMAKETSGYTTEQALEAGTTMDSGIIPVQLDAKTRGGDVTPGSAHRSLDEDADSDSDEGLTMMKTTRKKKPTPTAAAAAVESLSGHRGVFPVRRRDTNASIASTETAKKVSD